MPLKQEGIIRPNLFKECQGCQVASRAILYIQGKTLNNDIQVTCTDKRPKLLGFSFGKPKIIMEAESYYEKPTRAAEIALQGSIIPKSQKHFRVKDMTDKCPGLKTIEERSSDYY